MCIHKEKIMKYIGNKFIYILLAGFVSLSSCVDENFEEDTSAGLTDRRILNNVISEQADLSVFSSLLQQTGLDVEIVGNRTQDQRAVFAPTDAAFQAFLSENGYESAEDVPDLETLIAFHISTANVSANTLAQTNFDSIATLADINMPVARAGGQVRLNNQDVNILSTNAEGNGNLHKIDQVLVPMEEGDSGE